MSSPIDLSHAKKLRFLRKSNEKKQADVATVLGLSQQAYSKMENGETCFTDETIEKLSGYFKITPAEFEKPIDAINIGNNNSNTGTHINTIDLKFLHILQEAWGRNTKMLEIILDEKNRRIKELEELLSRKK